MPLSEEELRLLEQMERALAEEDPKFVSALQGRTLERSAQVRAVLAGLVFLAGLGLLVGGALTQLPVLSVVGFVVMVASATFGLSAWRGRHAFSAQDAQAAAAGSAEAHPSGGGQHPTGFTVIEGGRRSARNRFRGHGGRRNSRRRQTGGGGHASFMQRIEERWERRRHEGR